MSKKTATNIRAIAAEIIQQIHAEQQTLHTLLPEKINILKQQNNPQTAFLQSLCYGSCRWFFRLEAILDFCLSKSIRKKDRVVYYLLIIGIYQLEYSDKPEYAIVKETVDALNSVNKSWAKGLVNGILRRYTRERESITEKIDKQLLNQYSHPYWLYDRINKDWSSSINCIKILEANNQHPPMSLRINQSRFNSSQEYLEQLSQANIDYHHDSSYPWAITLNEPIDVLELPGFTQGDVSVQDIAPQQAAYLLEPRDGETLLDVCSAPGGKTGHLLELCQPQKLLALDNKKLRLERVKQTLNRLKFSADTKCSDALDLETWWDGTLYDKILLDVPCSATGVIRRNPDIKLTRTEQEINLLVENQQKFLLTIWNCLKPGGVLLYATCSILREENDQQIEKFLQQQTDAQEVLIQLASGHAQNHGWQILPGEDNMDGFYYAKLKKSK
ncbi:MAG: 16S rRNA (cytosine(967)-C(5))-methyltransferase RsmB [Gammaproteobacteria bacterium]|nr:16S rRNA (cytosine(967)-C(5))-methyltransferase RsmB [Gammaproteobacteria bacterium]